MNLKRCCVNIQLQSLSSMFLTNMKLLLMSYAVKYQSSQFKTKQQLNSIRVEAVLLNTFTTCRFENNFLKQSKGF